MPQPLQLPEYISIFVRRLAAMGYETWLLGSRANNCAREDSDWDLLVFGDADLLESLSKEPLMENADVLVVHDGNEFCSPWTDNKGRIKSGSLTQWKWERRFPTSAVYSGTKLPDDWGSPKNAVLLT
ncbi:nucleotidyltransferase domain-containing protein [Acidovorax facilis]|uniref:nucleotidyltransferase domain-containing protein n=1 Tax=Acidovorax facilis TaxID=12917 RepID=UPI003CEF0B76